MRRIPLSLGQYALIDEQDYELVSAFKWCVNRATGGQMYAVSTINGRQQKMHRLILGLNADDYRLVDHINGNGLDNRRENLRVCSYQQNAHNTKAHQESASAFKGVQKTRDKWQATITADGVRHYLGFFSCEVRAAIAYNRKARELHGEFARLNQIPREDEIAALLDERDELDATIATLIDDAFAAVTALKKRREAA